MKTPLSIFLIFSGDRSERMAKNLGPWLRGVFGDAINLWMAKEGPYSGRPGWFHEVVEHLIKVRMGIACVTRDNQGSAWLNFEVGACIDKNLKEPTIPFLLDHIADIDPKSPLLHMDPLEANEEGTWRVVATINGRLDKPRDLNRAAFKEMFERLRVTLDAIPSAEANERGFFGPWIRRLQVALLVGGRTVAREYLPHLKPVYLPPESQNSDGTMRILPEDVDIWLAGQDIRAASYLSHAFGTMGATVVTRAAETFHPEHHNPGTYVALGLGFTSQTIHLSQRQFHGGQILFEVDYSKPYGDGLTDQILFGPERTEVRPSTVRTDVCLVARVVERDSVMFVCAGRTAHGTAAAGHFLAHQWESIMALYDGTPGKVLDKDSVALIVEFELDPDRTRQVVCDNTGRISGAYPPRFARRTVFPAP